MIFSLCLVLFAATLTGISQVLLKTGSAYNENGKWKIIAAYLNLPTLLAYGLLVIVTIISVIALTEMPLKVLYAITSLNYVIVLGLSWLFLKEKVNTKMIIGTIFIISGILVFNLF
jgi:drug/metabolite transporter (DMT)-like permease